MARKKIKVDSAKDTAVIAVVLDRSGSMSSCVDATISGFNEFLKAQKAVEGEAFMTLVQFDHEYLVVHDMKPIAEVPEIDTKSYVPRGTTALLDAIGRTIEDIECWLTRQLKPVNVVLVVQTDGMENASQTFNRTRVTNMIAHNRSKHGWQVLFLGASEEAIQEARTLGVYPHHTIHYTSDYAGTQSAFGAASGSVSAARVGDERGLSD